MTIDITNMTPAELAFLFAASADPSAVVSARLESVVEELDKSDAAAILLGLQHRSFCNGSDRLVESGVWTDDGELTDLGYEVRDALRLRHQCRAAEGLVGR